MIVIPSIDLRGGNCVRLEQGDFSRETTYQIDPVDQSREFFEQGAQCLHVVDLDGAKFESQRQVTAIAKIRKEFPGKIQVGGGIRTQSDIESLLDMGIDRIVLGSLSVTNSSLTKAFFERFGVERFVIALDFHIQKSIPLLAIKGWQQQTNISLWDTVKEYSSKTILLCTDISRDGMGEGPSFDFYRELCTKWQGELIQASGGITTYKDIKDLKELGLGSAIVGKAFYQGKMSVDGAIECLK